MKLRKFIRAEKFYFQMLNDDGGVILESQAYQAKDARDNGIESVKNNIGNPERYDRLTEGGKQYFILKAGNNQEIGRSIGYTDENSLEAAMAYAQGSRSSSGEKKATPQTSQADGGEAYGNDGKDDDYKPLGFYESNGNKVESGFDSFSAEGESYFSYSLDSMIYMISEGYKSDAARDNGINSVEKNMSNEARYQRQVHPNGKHFFNLRAGNNQEIATSRWFDSEGDMNSIIGRLTGGSGSGNAGGDESSDTSSGIASVGISAAPEPTADTAPAKKRKKRTTPKKPKAEKVYITNGNYHFNDITYQLFRSGNNKHYFTFKNTDGKTILLNSDVRGFETPDQGEAKIAQVLKYAPDESNYEGKTTKNGKYYFYLKGDEDKNIAKSFFFNTQEDMQVAIDSLLGSAEQRAAMSSSDAPAAAAPSSPEPVKSEAKADDYLACREYEAHMSDKSAGHDDFITFLHDGEYYFAWVADGKIVMRSEGYTSESARDNGIASVIKNRELDERFSIEEKVGHFFTVLKAGNHQEIARSCPHKDKESARYWYPSSVTSRAEEAAAQAAAATAASQAPAPEPVKSEAKADDYLACREYEAHMNEQQADADGFINFIHDGEHYFAWVGDGKIIMRSEGYTSESARDNGIASVIKNRDLDERFSLDEKMGYFFTVLKAGNHQEIARSCPHKDKMSAMYWYPSEIGKRAEAERIAAEKKAVEEEAARKAAEEAAAKKAEEEAAAKKAEEEAAAAAATAARAAKQDDDYLHCKYYKGHARSTEHPDFSLFEEDGEFYFAMLNSDDEVVLRSEGYKSTKGRDNGMASVIKNREIDGRYSTDEKGGMYYVVLKAGNNQEIGRSCPYKEESRALGFIAPAAALAAVPTVVPDPDPTPEPEAPKDKEDDYLSCKEYEGRTVNDKKNNVALFKHDKDGQYYFALYDDNGDVLLRSEGFRDAKERDEELSGVLKYHDDKDMYKRMEKGKYFMDILYDKTGREVGRSCLQKKEAPAPAAPVAAAVATAAAVVAPKGGSDKDKEDDYLKCEEYEGRKVNDKKNNVALFKHEKDGQYYFALYDDNGDVLLRSEGFRHAKERDEELSGVLRYHDNKDMYKRMERGSYYMDILYDKKGREVGRSCLKKKGAPVAAAPVAAAVATAAAAVVAPKPVPKKVAATPVKEKVVAAPAATSDGGWFKWWMLLPLLLIPLWFFMKGCDKDVPAAPVKVETPAPKPAPVPVPEPEPEPVKAETPAPAPKPVVAGCNCSEKDIAIFNIPSTTAKSVARLGTYPEFGNSHALSPSEFYQKLSNRYSSNEVDRQYLDYVFRSMGYRGGFSDASASMFSNVELKRGQRGLLGLGEQHHYEYSALNTNDHDRQAFHIKSANGCDVHFMKTCGNYMFFCD